MGNMSWWPHLAATTRRVSTAFWRDIARGLWYVSHSMLALVGLGVVAGSLFVLGHADWRHELEEQLYGWLQEREAERLVAELDNRPAPAIPAVASASTTAPASAPVATPPAASSVLEVMAANAQAAFDLAIDPATLNRQQAAVTSWLARRYRVAQEPVARLVQESWHVGSKMKLDPTLILAVVAIESSFNPFAQSSVGAQGLMQVMTRIHDDKYQAFGGKLTAFDPVTNLRVGVQVLSECITKAGGSLEEGLKYYVGATNLDSDDGYAARVLNEQQFLTRVASGQKVPTSVSNLPVMAPPPQPEASPVAQASPAQVALLRAESSALTLH